MITTTYFTVTGPENTTDPRCVLHHLTRAQQELTASRIVPSWQWSESGAAITTVPGQGLAAAMSAYRTDSHLRYALEDAGLPGGWMDGVEQVFALTTAGDAVHLPAYGPITPCAVIAHLAILIETSVRLGVEVKWHDPLADEVRLVHAQSTPEELAHDYLDSYAGMDLTHANDLASRY